nr:uncharacterized protein CI109_002898 [Kwoniella shandongensis]KAA5528740.1 hypothetical protein CI109_002898 [Kwoniella shandongensis]
MDSTDADALLALLCATALPRFTHSHGYYATAIDNGPLIFSNGYPGPEQIQAVLYASSGVQQNNHQIVILNEASTNPVDERVWLDVDYVNIAGSPIDCSHLPDSTYTQGAAAAPASASPTTTAQPTTAAQPASPNTATDTPAISATPVNTDSSNTSTSSSDLASITTVANSGIASGLLSSSTGISSAATVTSDALSLSGTVVPLTGASLQTPHLSLNVPQITPGANNKMAIAGVSAGSRRMGSGGMFEGNLALMGMMFWYLFESLFK